LENGNWRIENGKWLAAGDEKKDRKEFTAEVAEKNRRVVTLDRKRPPFIPQKSRDGAEFAKTAKDGAPSSSFVGWR